MSLLFFRCICVFLFLLRPATRVNAFSRLASGRCCDENRFPRFRANSNKQSSLRATGKTSPPPEVDVVVIGSGLAGLSCAALLSHCGKKVAVLEAHDSPGGAAHSWERKGFHFESGPSLYSGFSTDRSPNPLKNIFQICEEDCEWITYDRWGTVLPNGEKFAAKLGPEEFDDVLSKYGGPLAKGEFKALMERMKPLSDAAQSLTSLAIREDVLVAFTLLKYPRELARTLLQGKELNQPFSKVMNEINITDKFVINWLDMLCFLLQGLPASDTMNAVMAYMLADWYRPGVTLDFPKGGSGAIVKTLVRAIEKNGSKVYTSCLVKDITVQDGKVSGVRLASGQEVKARNVISNADPYVTNGLLSQARDSELLSDEMDRYMAAITSTNEEEGGVEDLKSFIHLHAGIDATGLPETPSEEFPAQWAVIRDWDLPLGVEAPRNIVLCSMPSLIDPSLAPDGKHVLHVSSKHRGPILDIRVSSLSHFFQFTQAYVPATEPYSEWEGLDRRSEEYKKKKAEAADFLWGAVEEYIPNARERAIDGTVQIGTPLTHERFLKRTRGTYGPRVKVGKGQSLPGHKTPLPGLFLCGDFTFPGIGVPATAASGAITANSIVSLSDHLNMLGKIKLPL